jgi:hypothetical protein
LGSKDGLSSAANRLAAPFSIISHISRGGLPEAVSFRTICDVIENGMLEKTL